MNSEIPPHEKIRFRRSDLACLDDLPSAIPLSRPARLSIASRRAARIAAAIMLGVCGAIILAVAVIIAGFGDEQLRHEAQQAVAEMVGGSQQVTIGGVGVSFDGLRGVALRIDEVAIAPRDGDDGTTRIGSARIGLDILPLLAGRIMPRSLAIADASLGLEAFSSSPSGVGLPIFNDDGLVDPDRVAVAVFDEVRRLADLLAKRGVRRISADNVAVMLPDDQTVPLKIVEARLRRSTGDGLRLSALVEAFGRTIALRGEASLEPATREVSELGVYVDMQALKGAPEGDGALTRISAGTLLLSGTEGPNAAGRLTLSGRAQSADIRISDRDRDRLIADVEFVATLQDGTGKAEIERLRVTSGRSDWSFHGAVGPAPDGDAVSDAPPRYRYELVSDGSTVSPMGSLEPTLTVTARLGGHLSADARLIDVEEIRIRSTQGEAQGRAQLRLEPEKSPGLDFRIDVGEFPVGHAKQLWPWFAAYGARNWVMSNLFGGRVEGGWVEVSVPPGRLGNGVPLGAEEVSGFFAIDGTRFDVAGRIPPVRDGNGSVAFFGSDVDISLASGTVFLPSGRVVAASGGTLTIRDGHIRPVLGKLDIEVAGAADAVLELASYEPIDVSRFIDLTPAELKGNVSGNVVADIPLHGGVPLETLGWNVALSYDDLAVARPFEGQNVSNATGTIIVDPGRAVIEARARLNDLPAVLHLVEPLGKNGGERQRNISIEMDDKARNAIAPGLDALLSGVAMVEVDGAGSGSRPIKVDLRAAELSLPWVGWTKGAGVPATASFDMVVVDGRTELRNFNLRGESFAASGSVTLRGEGVERVRFPSMRLNRGDDFSVDVVRKGRGYHVAIRGKSLDARSTIKLIARDTAEAGSGGGDTPITVDVEVDALVGFHGEALRNARLNYAGTGARTERAELFGTTPGGQQIVFSETRNGELRNISLQAADAGGLLRFLDVYERMDGGSLALSLAGPAGGTLRGQVDMRDFWLVDEPRLSSLVSSPSGQDGRSLNQAVRGSIDTSRVQFERGYAQIVTTPGTLALERGILRGPLIGVSYQGIAYDGAGNMAMTGTFMPAYGLNRIFGEIPLIGQILGNGRDRGLIGITFRLAGKAAEPKLEINPLSVIAPGIFRSVFEFR